MTNIWGIPVNLTVNFVCTVTIYRGQKVTMKTKGKETHITEKKSILRLHKQNKSYREIGDIIGV